MGNIIVKNHTFQNELTKLDRMLKEKGTKLELQMVEEDGGLFGWGNHKVTGSEFNKSIKEIQGNFININNALTKIHNEFRSVYNTFDTLDKEYIAGILSALIESEQASNDIKKTQEGLKNNGVRLERTVTTLVEFKKKITNEIDNLKNIVFQLDPTSTCDYKHLQDIDTIWTDVENLKVRLENAENSIFLNQIEIEKINSKILEIVESDKVRRTRVDKRINIAYWLTGTSLTMIVVNIVLQLLGIL